MMPINMETILEYASRYDSSQKPQDRATEEKMKSLLEEQRHLGRDELVEIGVWKTPRQKRRYQSNDELAVKEITKFSFSAKSERARIGVLLALDGVSYAVASTILHFAFPRRYPILDFRALWSLGWKQPSSYNVEFWEKYCAEIRDLSKKLNLPIRTIDKALWQYSREHQGKRRKAEGGES